MLVVCFTRYVLKTILERPETDCVPLVDRVIIEVLRSCCAVATQLLRVLTALAGEYEYASIHLTHGPPNKVTTDIRFINTFV